jgi:hypothetical protein
LTPPASRLAEMSTYDRVNRSALKIMTAMLRRSADHERKYALEGSQIIAEKLRRVIEAQVERAHA